jgi:hypothetical protein
MRLMRAGGGTLSGLGVERDFLCAGIVRDAAKRICRDRISHGVITAQFPLSLTV